MKKALIASLVAAAASAPALADVYGQVDVRVQNGDNTETYVDSARIGFTGGTEGDVSSVYKVEFDIPANGRAASVDNDTVKTRKAYVGMDGSFGSIRMGRIDSPYAAGYVADNAYTGSGSFEAVPFRIGNSISYALPDFSGFSAFVSASMWPGDEGDSAVDYTTYGVTFDMAGFGVVLAGSQASLDQPVTVETGNNDTNVVSYVAADAKTWIIGLTYAINGFDISGHWEQAESDGEDAKGDGSFSVLYNWDGKNVGAGMSTDTGNIAEEDTYWAQFGIQVAEGANSTIFYKNNGEQGTLGLGVKVSF